MKIDMLTDIIDLFHSIDELGNFRNISEIEWQEARAKFVQALENENELSSLEDAVRYRWSWDLPVDLNLKLLKRAKDMGCDSFQFWQSYYKFQAAYLTPSDPEFKCAIEMANGKYL